MNKDKCLCCERELDGERCTYCGMEDVIITNSAEIEQRKKEIVSYRQDKVSAISSFYFKPYVYEVDAENEKLVLKRNRETVSISSGRDCFNKIAWTDNIFLQNTDENVKTREIEIFYDISGQTKSFVTSINLVSSDCPWALGIKIDDTLSATVYLGTKNNNTHSKKNDIEWV